MIVEGSVELSSLVIFIILMVAGYFIIKKFGNIIGSVLTLVVIIFVSIFVLRDIMKLNIDDYLDLSGVDNIRDKGLEYVGGMVEDGLGGIDINIDMGDKEEILLRGGLTEFEGFEVWEDLVRVSYEGLTKEKRIEIIERLGLGEEFSSKFMGMSSYVDLSYEVEGFIIRNSYDNKYIEIEKVHQIIES